MLAVAWGVSLVLVWAAGWSEAQHWDTHSKKASLVLLRSSVLGPDLRGAGALLLCLLDVSGSQINESWKNHWNPNPRCTPPHLVLWNVLEMFSWWAGAWENSFVCRNSHTLCRRATLPTERETHTHRERERERSLVSKEGLFLRLWPHVSWDQNSIDDSFDF